MDGVGGGGREKQTRKYRETLRARGREKRKKRGKKN